MDTCKYHPLQATVFQCDACQISTCESCVDYHDDAHEPRCVHCHGPLISVVNSENIAPFWRRIEQAFRYPVNGNTLLLIVILSVVSTVAAELLGSGLVSLVITLAAFGGLLKYSFMCLMETSEGEFTPPDITEALTGGLGLAFKMIAMIILMVGSVLVLAFYVHEMVALLAAVLYIIGLPAVIITFAHTQSIFAALNPIFFLGLIWRIGFPYAALLGFMLIMSGSVSLLDSLIGDGYAAVSGVLSMIVSNYYTVVMFHIMGYLLYQYRDRLGFSTDAVSEQLLPSRSPLDNLYAHIEVVVKEGDYQHAAQLFQQGYQQAPNDKRFSDHFFEFLMQTQLRDRLNSLAEPYLLQLSTESAANRLLGQFKRLRQVLPNFAPKNPRLRWRLAERYFDQGDYLQTVNLLKGLHKTDADFNELVPAYRCLAEALEALGKGEVAQQCRLLLKKLQTQSKHDPLTKGVGAGPVRFEASEPVVTSHPSGSAAFTQEDVAATEPLKDLPDIEFTRS